MRADDQRLLDVRRLGRPGDEHAEALGRQLRPRLLSNRNLEAHYGVDNTLKAFALSWVMITIGARQRFRRSSMSRSSRDTFVRIVPTSRAEVAGVSTAPAGTTSNIAVS